MDGMRSWTPANSLFTKPSFIIFLADHTIQFYFTASQFYTGVEHPACCWFGPPSEPILHIENPPGPPARNHNCLGRLQRPTDSWVVDGVLSILKHGLSASEPPLGRLDSVSNHIVFESKLTTVVSARQCFRKTLSGRHIGGSLALKSYCQLHNIHSSRSPGYYFWSILTIICSMDVLKTSGLQISFEYIEVQYHQRALSFRAVSEIVSFPKFVYERYLDIARRGSGTSCCHPCISRLYNRIK